MSAQMWDRWTAGAPFIFSSVLLTCASLHVVRAGNLLFSYAFSSLRIHVELLIVLLQTWVPFASATVRRIWPKIRNVLAIVDSIGCYFAKWYKTVKSIYIVPIQSVITFRCLQIPLFRCGICPNDLLGHDLP